jgi:hypothetical protein
MGLLAVIITLPTSTHTAIDLPTEATPAKGKTNAQPLVETNEVPPSLPEKAQNSALATQNAALMAQIASLKQDMKAKDEAHQQDLKAHQHLIATKDQELQQARSDINNAVAGLSPHLKGLIRKEVEASQTCVSSSVGGACVKTDKQKMPKGAKVTITIGEGWDSTNKKIDLNDDFSCPTNDDTSTWIETVEVNNVALSSEEVYSPAHFIINQANRRRVAIGTSASYSNTPASYSNTRRRRKTGNFDDGVYYEGQSNKKVSNWQWFPSTYTVMKRRERGHLEDYYKGKFSGSSLQEVTDGWDETTWWQINNGDDSECYAMAAYIATRVNGGKYFKKKENQEFKKYVGIRALKFSLCKMVNSVPKCAVRKTVVSCWYKNTDDSWQRCKEDDLFSASILSRS